MALWEAGYRSLDKFLTAVKQQLILEHGALPEVFVLHFRRISRAAARGRGPSKQAHELPFTRLSELSPGLWPWSAGGPCYPLRLLIIAIWWMLREVEAANLTLECVSISDDAATLRLPATKTDTQGVGTLRSLGCTCAAGPAVLFPMHALIAQYEWVWQRLHVLRAQRCHSRFSPTKRKELH